FERVKRHGVPLPREAPWPQVAALPADDTSDALPVPEKDLFEMPADAHAAFRLPSPRVDLAREAGTETRAKQAYARTGHAVRSHIGAAVTARCGSSMLRKAAHPSTCRTKKLLKSARFTWQI